jgi:hypothetical protein
MDSAGSIATSEVTQVVCSTPACGGHPPSAFCRLRSHAMPRADAGLFSPSAKTANTVGSVQDVPLRYGHPPSEFWAATSAATNAETFCGGAGSVS